ncbi:MAG: DUF2849 domain-containing protein [Xanthobacteraceae bacterium]|nr:DUF2849 domain-containing protein [Xanthobacteraceae bacterium]
MTSPLQQKFKVNGPVVVTANRTTDGIVIYRTANGWSAKIEDAAVAMTSTVALALLKDAHADSVYAIGSYVAPVEISESKEIVPGNLREKIRQAGPTFELPVSG